MVTRFMEETTFTVAHLLRLSEIGHHPDIKMVILPEKLRDSQTF